MSKDVVGGSSSSSAVGTPAFRKQIQSNIMGLLSPGADRNKSLGAFALNPEDITAVGEGYKRYTSPNYTQDLSKDPAIANLLDMYNTQSNQGLGEANAALRSRFALAGHSSTGGSDPLIQAQSDAGVRAGQNRDALASQALFGELQNREGQGMQALQLLHSLNLLPATIVSQIAPLLQKNKSSQGPGWLNAAMSGVGAVAAGAAACWVAREVYGENNPKWLVFRGWLLSKAPRWLRWGYLKFGERFARWLHDKPTAKNIIRILMDEVACE